MKKFVLDLEIANEYCTNNKITHGKLAELLNSKLDKINKVTLLNNYFQLEDMLKD